MIRSVVKKEGNMWIFYAAGSTFFAGITSILAKCGIQKTDSTVATALRTVVVLLFSWGMAWIAGSVEQIWNIDGRTLLFLVLSGVATGASWLCYYRALQLGDINKVVPIDKSSTVLTILLALVLLGEGISPPKTIAVFMITAGILLMIEKKDVEVSSRGEKSSWLLYAVGSAFFASLTSILGKIGISGVESNLGTAIRTAVVLVMAWGMVFVTGKQHEVKKVERKELKYLCLSGATTGASWLCYYKALQEGPASVVAPIDKLSVLVTVIFSYLVFGEKLKERAVIGLGLLTAGTVVMAFL